MSRQTVNNWETGKTLIDVQSLTLVAAVLGTGASELLGERGMEAVRAEAGSRHELVVLLGRAVFSYAVFFVATLIDCYVILLASPGWGDATGVKLLTQLPPDCRLCLELCLRCPCHPVHARTRPSGRHEALGVPQGSGPEDALPDDFLYRTFLPMWRFWLWLAAVGLLLLALLPAMLA